MIVESQPYFYFLVLISKADNEKLSAELHASVDQNTQMYEKVVLVSTAQTKLPAGSIFGLEGLFSFTTSLRWLLSRL